MPGFDSFKPSCARWTKFSGAFNAVLESEGVQGMPVGPCASNMNAFVERWVQWVKQECRDHFIILVERPLHYLASEYVRYYHAAQPHQGLGNELLVPPQQSPP